MKERVALLIQEREKLVRSLEGLGGSLSPAQSVEFVLIRCDAITPHRNCLSGCWRRAC